MTFILDLALLCYSFKNISIQCGLCGLCAEEVKIETNFNKSAFILQVNYIKLP